MTKNMIQYIKKYIVSFCLITFLLHGGFVQHSGDLQKNEYISSFDVTIIVHEDASMTVEEEITVYSAGKTIKHGIVRELPTRYKDRWGNNYIVDFTLEIVSLNNKAAVYNIIDVFDGKHIYIGDKNIVLPPGKYTFFIRYKTNRQLGFFDTFDELYWNVTGNEWRLPIMNASAKIILPSNISEDAITAEAYTGFLGAKEKNYETTTSATIVSFKTTKPLLKGQGLTVAVTWPKGFVTEPDWFLKLRWFLRDNLNIIIFLLGICLLFLYYLFVYFKLANIQKPGTIIPRFNPPENFSPGAVRYMMQKRYDDKILVAEIVSMAVQGMLTMEYKKHWVPLFKGYYILIKKRMPKKQHVVGTFDYRSVMLSLFNGSDSIELIRSNRGKIQSTIGLVQQLFKSLLNNYLVPNTFYVVIALLYSLMLLIFFIVSIPQWIFLDAIIFMVLLFLNVWFSRLIKTYTKVGRKIQDEISGFKMFLETTEKYRLKILGSPPTKTPELYEKYLPYAIALNVEKQWSKEFDSIFAQLEREGRPYSPIWYSGFGTRLNAAAFSDHLAGSLGRVISTSSGSRGRGSSGGGRGGGGGGGW